MSTAKPPKKNPSSSGKWWNKIENYLTEKQNKYFYILFSIHILLCFFSFDPRLSGANDDANYIEQGYKYARDFFGYFYTAQAPLYPMFLAVPIAIVGVNLIILKIITLLLNLLAFFLLYKMFRNQVSNVVLFGMLLITAVNYHFLYYSTHTFNETFYMVLQSLFLITLLTTSKLIENAAIPISFLNKFKSSTGVSTGKFPYLMLLLTGFLAVLLMLAKNAAIGIGGVIVLFFAFRKKWASLIFCIGFYLMMYAGWNLTKSIIWGDLAKSNYKIQMQILRQKHPYDASKGYDDTKGFIQRFTDNCQVMLSNRLMESINLKSDESSGNLSKGKKALGYHPLNENDPSEFRMPFLVSKFVTWMVILILFFSLWIAWKYKHEMVLLSGIQASVILGTTFLMVHVFWAQHRFIYIFIPSFIILILNMFWTLGEKYHWMKNATLISIFILFFSGISLNHVMIQKQGKILASAYADNQGNPDKSGAYKLHFRLAQSLLTGDKFSGYTEDWKNYLKMCEWAGKNIPDTATIAVRKPGEAFIYGNGRNFRGLYQAIPGADSTLKVFKQEKIRFVILASLRLNQDKNDGNIINTVHRMLQPLEQTYPGMLKLIHKEGTTEAAELYQINW